VNEHDLRLQLAEVEDRISQRFERMLSYSRRSLLIAIAFWAVAGNWLVRIDSPQSLFWAVSILAGCGFVLMEVVVWQATKKIN